MKIKFELDNDLPLRKKLRKDGVMIIIRSIFLATTNINW